MSASPLFATGADAGPEPYEDLPAPRAWFQARAAAAGADYDDEALGFVTAAGGVVVRRRLRVEGHRVDALVRGANGSLFLVAAHGTPGGGEGARDGLRRTDTVLKLGCRAVMLSRAGAAPLLVITSALPSPSTSAGRYLDQLAPDIYDVVATTGDLAGFQRLRHYLTTSPAPPPPGPCPWRSGPGREQLVLFGGHDA